jgi:hypothetical protein
LFAPTDIEYESCCHKLVLSQDSINSIPQRAEPPSHRSQAKTEFVNTGAARQLQDMGFSLFATKSTHEQLGAAPLGFSGSEKLLMILDGYFMVFSCQCIFMHFHVSS